MQNNLNLYTMKKLIILLLLAFCVKVGFSQSTKQVDSMFIKFLNDFKKRPDYQFLINDSTWDSEKKCYLRKLELGIKEDSAMVVVITNNPQYKLVQLCYVFKNKKLNVGLSICKVEDNISYSYEKVSF